MHGSYVRQVAEDTRRYAQQILEENAELRKAVAVLHAAEDERLGAIEAVDASRLTIHELREKLGQVEVEKAQLNDELAAVRNELAAYRSERDCLCRQLQDIDAENRRFADEFFALEQQSNNLANLYVAAYRLHETLERATVIRVLQEILANLVGSEEMALFETTPDGRSLSLTAWSSIEPERFQTIPVGVGVIGRAVATGETYMAGSDANEDRTADEARLTACVPLRLGDKYAGAIAVFGLLPQKPSLEDLDREIFDLLASQAAMALYCTSLHERVARGELQGRGGRHGD